MTTNHSDYLLQQVSSMEKGSEDISEKKRQYHEEPENINKKKAKKELELAGTSAVHMLPTVTCSGLGLMFDTSGKKDILSGLVNIFGFFVAVSGLIIDPVKAPIAAGFSLKGLFAAGWYSIKSLVGGNPAEYEQIREIIASFEIRCAHTMKMLITLGLETSDSLQEKFSHSKGTRSIYALTTLSTALASRGYSTKAISLSNGKILHREDCPSKGLEIFDQVVMIRDVLREANLHQKTNRQVMALIVKWVPLIKEALDTKKQFKVLLKEKVNDKFEVPSDAVMTMLDVIVKSLLKIGKKSQGLSYLKECRERLQWEALRQVAAIPKDILSSLNEQKSDSNSLIGSVTFVDHFTKRPLEKSVIGSDGYFYNVETVQQVLEEKIITHYFKILVNEGKPVPGITELTIDPILMNEITTAVVANDGLFYEEDTVLRMINGRGRGPLGIVLDSYIKCREIL